jgi:hypothetical protein
MIYQEITNKKTGKQLVSIIGEDFEQVDPIKYYEDSFILKRMILAGVPVDELNGEGEITEKSKNLFIESIKLWREKHRKINQLQIPHNLIKLLSTTKKSEQEKLLKGVILTPEILISFFFKAHSDCGYTLSQYSSEILPKGVDKSKMPLAYILKKTEIEIFGKTELSDGQLKQAIQHRKVTVAKFLERGNNWHCFFTTFKSLKGEETWQGQKQPHFHYISDRFGLIRENVILELKSAKYKLGNLPHITIRGYGNQPPIEEQK